MIIDRKPLSPKSSQQGGATILVIEPDEDTRRELRLVLQDNGFDVIEIINSLEAFVELEKKRPDLIIMEYCLPGTDSAKFVREICDQYEVPVILISLKARVIQKIICFEMGADDFLTKPFEFDELVARARAVLRRRRPKHETLPPTKNGVISCQKLLFCFDDLSFDMGRRELRSAKGQLIELTSMEIDLLYTFVQSPQRPLSRMSIIQSLGKGDDGAAIRTIDVLVSKLRKKLENGNRDTEIIKTVRGAGYLFTPEILQQM
jgi:two-component system, OmpR family, response regulator